MATAHTADPPGEDGMDIGVGGGSRDEDLEDRSERNTSARVEERREADAPQGYQYNSLINSSINLWDHWDQGSRVSN